MNSRNRSRRGSRTRALATRLARFDQLVEVGIGARTGIAEALADNGVDLTAMDINSCTVPEGVEFACDDVTDPTIEIYTDAEAVYALNLPRELHRPVRDLAREVDAEFLFTTLGGEFPAISADSEMLPDETLFQATKRGRTEQGERT